MKVSALPERMNPKIVAPLPHLLNATHMFPPLPTLNLHLPPQERLISRAMVQRVEERATTIVMDPMCE